MRNISLLKFHFGLLLLLLLHFFLLITYRFGLHSTLVFWLSLGFYASGAGLFFSYFRKRRFLKFYGGIFVFYPVLAFLGWLVDGILGAILGTFLLLFFFLPTTVSSDRDYTLKTRYAGLMSACCPYTLYENYGLFEKPVLLLNAYVPAKAVQQIKINPAKTRLLLYYTSDKNKPAVADYLIPAE